MNVAKLELCKELFELSGWEYDSDNRHIEKVWMEMFSTSEMGQGHPYYSTTPIADRRQYHIGDYRVTDNPKNHIGIPEDVPWGWANRYYNETLKRSVPAYDCGYLLRKLPNGVSVVKEQLTDKYNAGLPRVYRVVANTPEDTLAQLAIELFKQKILTTNNQEE